VFLFSPASELAGALAEGSYPDNAATGTSTFSIEFGFNLTAIILDLAQIPLRTKKAKKRKSNLMGKAKFSDV